MMMVADTMGLIVPSPEFFLSSLTDVHVLIGEVNKLISKLITLSRAFHTTDYSRKGVLLNSELSRRQISEIK